MDEKLSVVGRKTLYCTQPDLIVEFFRQHAPFKVVFEATASYLWFVELVEPLAEKIVMANPKKLRVIAEPTKKTDRLDAQVLAEFLARDMIPETYKPTLRQRQHRSLVRHGQYIRGQMTSVNTKIRRILSDYNADRKNLFSFEYGKAYLKQVPLSDADRFVISQLWSEYVEHDARLAAVAKKIKGFAAKAPRRAAEARSFRERTAHSLCLGSGQLQRMRNLGSAITGSAVTGQKVARVVVDHRHGIPPTVAWDMDVGDIHLPQVVRLLRQQFEEPCSLAHFGRTLSELLQQPIITHDEVRLSILHLRADATAHHRDPLQELAVAIVTTACTTSSEIGFGERPGRFRRLASGDGRYQLLVALPKYRST